MSNNIREIKSNPFSTGGGGYQFEYLVGAYYLSTLLTQGTPRGIKNAITKEVGFQRQWEGALIDDIIVKGILDDEERKLALQVKHDLTFGENNKFETVIEDCWKTFNNDLEYNFNKEKDKVGVGVHSYAKKVDTQLIPLLGLAKKSASASEFNEKVNTSGFTF